MLAIAGGKGGSGKTTTAAGIALMLARRGSDPLLVDCDTDMPDLHHLLGDLQLGGIDRLASGAALERACSRSSTVPGVRCLTGGDCSNVADALARLTGWHGPVVVDCPPGAGPDAVRPLRVADCAVLVSTDQPAAVTDTVRTARTAGELGTEVLGVLLRETSPAVQTEVPEGLTVLARVDSVDSPLEHPQVRTAWTRVAESADSNSVSPATNRGWSQ